MLPEIISKEPLSPAVRQGDDTWEDIVRWTHYAMVDAEELGVNQHNIDECSNPTRRIYAACWMRAKSAKRSD